MNISEKFTNQLAKQLSRRKFLKTLGFSITGLGVLLAGKAQVVNAHNTCSESTNPACSGCTGGGSIWPFGVY